MHAKIPMITVPSLDPINARDFGGSEKYVNHLHFGYLVLWIHNPILLWCVGLLGWQLQNWKSGDECNIWRTSFSPMLVEFNHFTESSRWIGEDRATQVGIKPCAVTIIRQGLRPKSSKKHQKKLDSIINVDTFLKKLRKQPKTKPIPLIRRKSQTHCTRRSTCSFSFTLSVGACSIGLQRGSNTALRSQTLQKMIWHKGQCNGSPGSHQGCSQPERLVFWRVKISWTNMQKGTQWIFLWTRFDTSIHLRIHWRGWYKRLVNYDIVRANDHSTTSIFEGQGNKHQRCLS